MPTKEKKTKSMSESSRLMVQKAEAIIEEGKQLKQKADRRDNIVWGVLAAANVALVVLAGVRDNWELVVLPLFNIAWVGLLWMNNLIINSQRKQLYVLQHFYDLHMEIMRTGSAKKGKK